MNSFAGSPNSAAAAATAIIAAFNRKTGKSKAASAENQRVLSDKSSIGVPFSLLAKEALYPIVVDHADGAHLSDIDGNRYVDVLMGMGINLFGHNPPFIRAAIEAQLGRSFALGPQSDLTGETAALFCKLTGKDRVTFTNTGTEAVMTALRIARAATGRRKVAMFIGSYHGHSDQVLNRIAGPDDPRTVPAFPGVSPTAAEDVVLLPYDDPRALEILEREGETLAAVLVEPVQSRDIDVQPRAFLHALRDLTHRTGTVLLFDEMISGFRIASGGAQAHFGVEADLATYGKIAGGGLPLALIAGSNRMMNHIDGGPWAFGDDSAPPVQPTFFAGTYCRHPLALAAARAAAAFMLEQGPALQDGLTERTRALVERLNTSLAAARLPVIFTHFGSFFSIAVNRSRIPPLALGLLSLELLTNGIHLRGGDKGGFLSTAHTDGDIAAIHDALLNGLQSLAGFGLLPLSDGTMP